MVTKRPLGDFFPLDSRLCDFCFCFLAHRQSFAKEFVSSKSQFCSSSGGVLFLMSSSNNERVKKTKKVYSNSLGNSKLFPQQKSDYHRSKKSRLNSGKDDATLNHALSDSEILSKLQCMRGCCALGGKNDLCCILGHFASNTGSIDYNGAVQLVQACRQITCTKRSLELQQFVMEMFRKSIAKRTENKNNGKIKFKMTF